MLVQVTQHTHLHACWTLYHTHCSPLSCDCKNEVLSGLCNWGCERINSLAFGLLSSCRHRKPHRCQSNRHPHCPNTLPHCLSPKNGSQCDPSIRRWQTSERGWRQWTGWTSGQGSIDLGQGYRWVTLVHKCLTLKHRQNWPIIGVLSSVQCTLLAHLPFTQTIMVALAKPVCSEVGLTTLILGGVVDHELQWLHADKCWPWL